MVQIIRKNKNRLLLLLLFLILFIQYDHRAPKRNFSDFHVPYISAKRLLNNQAIYTFEGGLSYYKYPVLYAFLMTPLTKLSERNAARLWFGLNLVFLCLIFYISRKIISPRDSDYSVRLLYFAGALLSFRFILENLHEGQVNIFMLFLLLCALYFIIQQKEVLAGFFLAFSIMLKYMPVLFLPYFLFRKRFKLVAKTLFFILILTFIPVLLVGWERMILLLKQQFVFLFPSAMDDYSITCYPNQSLLACLARFFYKQSWFNVKVLNFSRQSIFLIFIVFASILYLLILLGRDKGRFSSTLNFALIILCATLFNPNAWKNFFVLIIFPYLVVVYYLIKTKSKDKLVLGLLVSSFILNSLTSEFFVQSWATDKFEIYSSVTLGTLILFFALVRLKFGNDYSD